MNHGLKMRCKTTKNQQTFEKSDQRGTPGEKLKIIQFFNMHLIGYRRLKNKLRNVFYW
jgi:hypothetical protein